MSVTIGSYRRFPVPCPVACNAAPFLKLPLEYFLGFWLLIMLLVLSSGPVYMECVVPGRKILTGGISHRDRGKLSEIWSKRSWQETTGDLVTD